MESNVLKIELESETCCICGSSGELFTLEEHDASAPPGRIPLRAMLVHLNNNKVVPDGRICNNCAHRTVDSYEFSITLSSRETAPLSEKIRAIRRKLYELTQKVDVYIVVGGAGAGPGGTYSEDDIIMVERDALAAATAADDEDMERARDARGDSVYPCSVCPLTFKKLAEYRQHMASHSDSAIHCCWTCGAQFTTREAQRDHARTHAMLQLLTCHLCHRKFESLCEMKRHESGCPSRCPACEIQLADRDALVAHVTSRHGRGTHPPLVCPVCFILLPDHELLSTHLVNHRQARQFVCGYDGCILRFSTRENLMFHIRKVHGAEIEPSRTEPPSTTCEQCDRTFGTVAALKRHLYVHRVQTPPPGPAVSRDANEDSPSLDMECDTMENEVEYLEVETLEVLEEEFGKFEKEDQD